MYARCITAALICASSFAQAPQQTEKPEIKSEDATPTFTSRVNLVLVRVIVRDRKGNAIGTLKKEDFQLFDKGKPQVISKFSLEQTKKPGEAASVGKPSDDPNTPAIAVADRFTAYMFDDVHVQIGDLMQARNAAGRHFEEALQNGGRAAIYTTSGRVTEDFTDDIAKLRAALERIVPHPRAPRTGTDCPDLSFYMADAIQNRHDVTLISALTAEAIACLGLDPTQPSSQQIAQQAVLSSASRLYNIGESETRENFTALRELVRRLSIMPGQRTIVLVSPGFVVPNDDRSEESELLERALRANVMISALDARGLYVDIPGGDASRPSGSTVSLQVKSQYDRESAMAEGEVLAELAEGTGGTWVHNSNDLDGGFKRVVQAPEYSYVLGFSPQNLKNDGSYHALKVKLPKGTDLMLQARRGYYAPRRAPNAEEQAKQEISEAIFSRDEMQDIPLEVHTQFFKSSDTTAKLAVVARVDASHLRFLKQEGRNHDTLTVVSAVFDRNGNYIAGTKKTIEMRLRDQTLESVLHNGILIKTSFDVTPGDFVVRVVLRDSGGETMAARNGAVQIPY